MFNVGILYALMVALVAYIKSNRDKKKLLTLEFIKRWNEREFHKLTNSHDNNDEFSFNKSEYKRSLLKITAEIHLDLSFFEELSLAIFNGQADEKVARDYFLYYLVETYTAAEKTLFEERNIQKKGLFRNVERLYGKWLEQDNRDI